MPEAEQSDAGLDASARRTRTLGAQTIGGSLWTAGSTVASAILSGASTIIVARALGNTGFGRYNYLFYVVVLLTKLSDVGITARITNSLVTAVPLGDVERIRSEVRALLRFGLVKAFFLSAVIAALLHRAPLAAGIACGATFLQIATTALSTVILAQKRFRLLSLAGLGVTATQSVLTSWVAVQTASAELTLAVFLGGQVIAAIACIVLAPWSLIRGDPAPTAPTSNRRGNWSTQLAFYVSGVCQLIIFGKSEIVVLARTDQAVALGLFAIATTVAARATLLTDALQGALLPSIGEASGRESEAMDRAYATSIRFSSLLVLITTLVLGPPMVIYGPEILGAHGAAVQIAVAATLAGSLLQTFVYPLTVIASVEMQRRTIVAPLAIGATVDVVAAIALIPGYGIYGAATASLLAAVTYVVMLCRMLSLPSSAARTLRQQLLRVSISVAALAGCGLVTAPWPHVVAIAVVSLVGLAAYASAGRVHGVLTASDMATLRAAMPGRRIVPSSVRRLLPCVLLVRKRP